MPRRSRVSDPKGNDFKPSRADKIASTVDVEDERAGKAGGLADHAEAPSAIAARRARGRPSLNDAASGRCLGIGDLLDLPDGTEVDVIWRGGAGPQRVRTLVEEGAVYALSTHIRARVGTRAGVLVAPNWRDEGHAVPGHWIERPRPDAPPTPSRRRKES